MAAPGNYESLGQFADTSGEARKTAQWSAILSTSSLRACMFAVRMEQQGSELDALPARYMRCPVFSGAFNQKNRRLRVYAAAQALAIINRPLDEEPILTEVGPDEPDPDDFSAAPKRPRSRYIRALDLNGSALHDAGGAKKNQPRACNRTRQWRRQRRRRVRSISEMRLLRRDKRSVSKSTAIEANRYAPPTIHVTSSSPIGRSYRSAIRALAMNVPVSASIQVTVPGAAGSSGSETITWHSR
ncbi:hypothetical protein [Bradyrhizobium sp. USDA 4454]